MFLVMSNNNGNNPTMFAIPAILLLLLLLLSFSLPSVTMAQQQTGVSPTTTTTLSSPPPSPLTTGQTTAAPLTPAPPLTPQEQEQQSRLQNVIAATNQNLDEVEKQVGGVVYTPRWSDPVWVEPNSLSVLFAYCLPGEFAESGQEILGGFELEVLESYEVALAQGFMVWMMVIGNEDRQDRLPAAVGVICASDANDVETRVLSPDEQQQINNVVQQFTTQVTNIEQVINIINNVTTNATTTGGPVTPPPPSPTNATRDTTPPGYISILPVVTSPASYNTKDPKGLRLPYYVDAEDNIDGSAKLNQDNTLSQDDIGGSITISCNPPSNSLFPVGDTTIQCTAMDQAGNVATKSRTVTIVLVPDTTPPSLSIGVGPPSIPLPTPYTIETNDPQGLVRYHVVEAHDDVDGGAVLDPDNNLIQMDDIGGNITISCDPPSPSIFPVGNTRVECTAVDQAGNVGTASFTIRVEFSPFSPPGALVGNTTAAPAIEEPPVEEEEEQPTPPVAEEEEAPVEEQPPATEEEEQPPPTAADEGAPAVEEEATTSPPANEGGG